LPFTENGGRKVDRGKRSSRFRKSGLVRIKRDTDMARTSILTEQKQPPPRAPTTPANPRDDASRRASIRYGGRTRSHQVLVGPVGHRLEVRAALAVNESSQFFRKRIQAILFIRFVGTLGPLALHDCASAILVGSPDS
jgi:hypothetical protein